MKLEYLVVYENISDKFDVGHCRTKVKVTAHLPQYKLSGLITTCWEAYFKHVYSSDTIVQNL